MGKIEESEQWLLNGDCSKCRREKYCDNPCSKTKRRQRAEMVALVDNFMNEATGGAYGKMIANVDREYMDSMYKNILR